MTLKNDADHEAALEQIEALMESENLTEDQQNALELLGELVDQYEEDHFPVRMPTPVEAIRFRMEQMHLKQKDLIPYIGSKSKVSEVLAGRRKLSLSMIRRLHEGMGIPAEVLIQEPGGTVPEDTGIEWLKFPVSEMVKKGWFSGFTGTLKEAKETAEELITDFARPVGVDLLQPMYPRSNVNSSQEPDMYALAAWRIRVCRLANEETIPQYKPRTVSKLFVRRLVRLSYFEDGPALAKEYLNKNGIHLIIEEHLKKTYLDGAAMTHNNGEPLIAMTLRHDRLDNFWFTLCHELAHIALHIDDRNEVFFDDTENEYDNDKENAANRWASEVLIEHRVWEKSGLSRESTEQEIIRWSNKHQISPAIPAGRIRKEAGNYKIFSKLTGNRKVRCQFQEIV